MAFTEDVTLFFDDFGESATWNGSTSVTVLFDNAFQLLGGVVEGSNPMAIAMAAEMPTAAQDDTLAIGGTTYVVVSVEPDATRRLLNLELVKQ